MATPTGDSEQVRYDILIEAKAAIQAMRDMLKYTNDNTVKMAEFTNQVMLDSKRWGVSWQQALGVYKQLNAELAKSKKGTLFGRTGGQDLFKMSENYMTSLEQAGRLQSQVSQGAEDMGKAVESGSKKAVRGIDAVRIAVGALVAMILFRAIQAIETFFRQAVDQATQFEETLYRLRNVEESLSLQGIEISMKGLKKGIDDIQKLLPIFSKEDVSQLVGNLAISTKQLGLNEKQILDLAKAVGVLNVRSEKQEDLSTTAQHVLSSLLTGNAKGITSLGIAFTDNVMRAKAMELGFLEAGEALSTLTENEKGLTKLNIVLESTANETENISEYLDTNAARLKENSAAWKDLQTTVGQVILPFIPALTEFFQLITNGFNGLKVGLIELGVAGKVFVSIWQSITSLQPINVEKLKSDVEELRSTLVNEFFKDVPEDAPDWFMQGWGKHIKEQAETATGPLQDLGEAAEELDFSKLEEKIQDVLKDTAQNFEDLNIDLVRKLDDIDEEYRRKALDAERDYLRKVEDINRDYEDDIAQLKKKHRQEDEKDEAKYQLALWELRMRFLMNLEDALHARDARQVLRLQKQYAIDKETLRRKHELENKEREQSQADEIEDAELRRQQRLEDARLEYEQKLADLNLAKQREIEDLNTWYERQFSDLQLAQDRKLKELLRGWAEEQNLTQSGAQAVYGILSKYFGPGGYTDQLYAYMMQSMVAHTQAAMAGATQALSGGFGNLSGAAGTSSGASSTGVSTNIPGIPGGGSKGGRDMEFAEGGTLLATRPTRAVFGDGGPEMVNFTPLNRVGKNINKVFGDRSALDGMNGTLRVAVDLSPDLEGRIVEQSLDGVAEVISSINRSKV